MDEKRLFLLGYRESVKYIVLFKYHLQAGLSGWLTSEGTNAP